MKKKILVGISIVSHRDATDIYSNHSKWGDMCNEDVQFVVVVKDNTGDKSLQMWCKERRYYYSKNLNQRGFGENNNHNYEFLNSLYMLDYFLIVNPDVSIKLSSFTQHLCNLDSVDFHIMGAKVEEEKGNKYVSQKRSFPALFDPIISLIFKRKLFIRDPHVSGLTDWVGGSFMLIKSYAFQKLGGFDEAFFMYYEDMDLCKRAKLLDFRVYYNSDLEYFHSARRQGRKIGSRHFFWNLQSMIRYFFRYPTIKLLSIGKNY